MQALDLKKVTREIEHEGGHAVMVIFIDAAGKVCLGLPMASWVLADLKDLLACRQMLEGAISEIDMEIAPHALFNRGGR